MKNVRPWVSALGISEDDYQRWTSGLPAGQSATYHCLKAERIPSLAYLVWAQNHYELPLLNDAFFQNPPPNLVFEQLKTVAHWGPEMIPVGEWDGVVYIACVEPIEEVNWSFQVCYVLAAPKHLESYWNRVNSNAPTSVASTPTVKEELTVTAFPPQPSAPTPDLFSSLEAEVAKPKEPAVQNAPLPADTLEGLNLKIDTATGPAPEGLSLSGLPDLPENTMTAIFAPPVLETPKVASPTLNATVSETNSSFSSLLKSLQSDFKGAIIFKVESENLIPLAWDEHFKPANQNQKGLISLSQASAFRIAYRTKMPYLGHVVETPTNADFFKNWGFAKAPEQIVVQPIIENNTWLGLILLIADTAKRHTQILTAAESASQKAISIFKTTNTQAA